VDAHKKDLFIAMLVGEGQTPVTWTVPNEPNAVKRLVRKLERDAPGLFRAGLLTEVRPPTPEDERLEQMCAGFVVHQGASVGKHVLIAVIDTGAGMLRDITGVQ